LLQIAVSIAPARFANNFNGCGGVTNSWLCCSVAMRKERIWRCGSAAALRCSKSHLRRPPRSRSLASRARAAPIRRATLDFAAPSGDIEKRRRRSAAR
jgi:hypothetical protein